MPYSVEVRRVILIPGRGGLSLRRPPQSRLHPRIMGEPRPRAGGGRKTEEG